MAHAPGTEGMADGFPSKCGIPACPLAQMLPQPQLSAGLTLGLSKKKVGRKHVSCLATFSLFPSRTELEPICIYLVSSE